MCLFVTRCSGLPIHALCAMFCVREIKARRLALHRRENNLTFYFIGTLSYEIKKALQSHEGRVITMYITLSDLIQFCLLLVTLVIACYTIFKDKKD